LGDSFSFMGEGVALKRFPCCGAAIRSVDCLLELRAEHGFAAGDVEQVVATVGLLNFRNLRWPEPVTTNEAKFSMQYCLAVALLQGKLGLDDFTQAAIARPEVRALLGRVALRHHPDTDADAAKAHAAPPPHEVVVVLKDGRRLVKSRAHAVGSAQDPLGEGDREAKFLACTSGRLAHDEALRLRAAVSDFARVEDVRALMANLNAQLGRPRGP
jgi:2-methylcitrate dehydratase PrpD